MITRIYINGFKSLLNTELYLGPFTCIAGANAAGKSNFFDALLFLANLADKTILQAAKSIRSEEQKHSNIKDIFFKCGTKQYHTMEFEVDMLVPRAAEDDLGQTAETSVSSLRYSLTLKLNSNANNTEQPIEIVEESLLPMTRESARKSIGFEYEKEWLTSVLFGRRTSSVISYKNGKVQLHQDTKGKRGGRAAEFVTQKMPRTLLSTVTAESPTAFLARQEMRNWQMLQFEPTALRQPNSLFEVINSKIDANGRNLPATLYRLSQHDENDVYQRLTNQLKNLVSDIKIIGVDRDEKRELLTLVVKFKSGLELPAQSLSDGTLRFLGLSVIQEDSRDSLICMEEPENGINPKKIEDIVRLLQDMAFDPYCPIGTNDNPARQVIINTHSPKLIGIVPEDSLYFASVKEKYDFSLDMQVQYTGFSILPDTYKVKKYNISTASLGEIKSYLDNGASQELKSKKNKEKNKRHRTVSENVELQQSFDF